MNILLEHAVRSALPTLLGEEKLSFIKYTTAGSAVRDFPKVLLFVFREQEENPFALIKIARSPADNQTIIDGFARLTRLRELAARGGALDLFPKPLYLGEFQKCSFSIEEAIAGERPVFSDTRKILKVYAEFQRALATLRRTVSKRDVGESLIDQLPLATEEKSGLRNYFLQCMTGDDKNAIQVPQHGDLTEDNVLISGSRVVIIDTDRFIEDGISGYDVYHYVRRNKKLWVDFKTHMDAYLRDIGFEGTFSRADVFMWYLVEQSAKLRAIPRERTGKDLIASFEKLVNTNTLS